MDQSASSLRARLRQVRVLRVRRPVRRGLLRLLLPWLPSSHMHWLTLRFSSRSETEFQRLRSGPLRMQRFAAAARRVLRARSLPVRRLHCVPKMLALGIILVLHSHMPPALEIRSAAPAVCPPRPTTTADLSSPLTARASRDRRKSRERGGVATRWHATCKRVLQVGSLRSGRDGKTLTVGTDVHHES
jgi:hypothetical protein